MIETLVAKKRRASKTYSLLKSAYPNAQSPLYYAASHELLIANILLDNCTYDQVNAITKVLFKKYHSIQDFAYCNLNSLKEDIYSIANQNEKAHNIKHACLIIIEQHNGVVPSIIDDLIILPGIGKNASCSIINELYNIPTIALDIHMLRIIKLLEFTRSNDPEKIRFEIMEIFEEKIWLKITYLMIKHGEEVCIEARPQCESCIIYKLCPSSFV